MKEIDVFHKFIYEQAPLVTILIGVVCFMYRYFIKVMDKREAYFKEVIDQRDKMIVAKDEIITANQEKLIGIINQHASFVQQFTVAFTELKRSIDELRNSRSKHE